MYWTLELASKLEDAPWPATKEELIDYALRSGAPMEVIENLQEIEDEGDVYESIEDIWPDYPTKDDFFFHEDEYWLTVLRKHHKTGFTSRFFFPPETLGFASFFGLIGLPLQFQKKSATFNNNHPWPYYAQPI